jgi:FkbM family methyltransferase
MNKKIAKGFFSLCRPSLWPSLAMGVVVSIENLPVMRAKRFLTVIDVGANKGQFSLAARVASPAATIEAFEPVVEAAQIYRQVFDGAKGVTLHEVAAGAEDGEVPMRVPAHNDGASMIVPLDGKVRNVRVARLDAIIKNIRRPALLKLDVQGYELEALKGATGLLPDVDDVLCEVAFISPWANLPEAHEIIAFMRENGFRIGEVRNVSGLAGISAIADIHFVRSSA